jgi:hypothetical protein
LQGTLQQKCKNQQLPSTQLSVLPVQQNNILRNNFHTVKPISTKLGTVLAGHLTTEMQQPTLTDHTAVSVASSLKQYFT